MKGFEFLEKSSYFSDKRDDGEKISYTFFEENGKDFLRCWLTIPKIYHPTLWITFEVYGADYFYQVQAPSWFSSLLEQTRQVYMETNKLRHAFYQQKHVSAILKETLLIEPSKPAEDTWFIFESFGTIATKDEHIYENLKKALHKENYEFNTDKKEEYFRIYLIKT